MKRFSYFSTRDVGHNCACVHHAECYTEWCNPTSIERSWCRIRDRSCHLIVLQPTWFVYPRQLHVVGCWRELRHVIALPSSREFHHSAAGRARYFFANGFVPLLSLNGAGCQQHCHFVEWLQRHSPTSSQRVFSSGCVGRRSSVCTLAVNARLCDACIGDGLVACRSNGGGLGQALQSSISSVLPFLCTASVPNSVCQPVCCPYHPCCYWTV